MAEWATKADAVCASAQSRLRKIAAPTALGEVSAYVDATAPIVEDELAKLRALARPAQPERVDAYLERFKETVESVRAVGAAAADGNGAEARARGAQTQRLTRETRELARGIGADTCASQGTA